MQGQMSLFEENNENIDKYEPVSSIKEYFEKKYKIPRMSLF